MMRTPPNPTLPALAGVVVARWEEQLPELLAEYDLPRDGVVQVGAHTGQEVGVFTRLGFRRLVMMEPNEDHLLRLAQRLREQHEAAGLPLPADGLPPREVVRAAAGRVAGQATLYVTEYDQQSSMLAPLGMAVTREVTIPVVPVSAVQAGCNLLVVDAQGAELDVLAGADLERFQLVVVEGSAEARYTGGSTVESIAGFLRQAGWRQVAVWAHVRPDVYDMAWLGPTGVA
jgi:FkbM family methyltransferase